VRFIPNKEINKLGTVDYTQENNILAPKKVALIVGKYFNESFYMKAFQENFQKLYGKKPTSSDLPILFTPGEYFSAVLGDSGTGLSSKDRISLFGIDSMSVIDRFMYPKVTKSGNSLERTINEDELTKAYNNLSYDLVSKDYFLKNGTKLSDYVFMPDRDLGDETEWKESNFGGTPGLVHSIKRVVASEINLYTIEADVVDVANNKFVKGLVVIESGKFKDIVAINDKKYPAPIIRDVIMYPGMIDGHNHIKYNTMPIWKTSKTYDNRNQWPEESVYKNGIKELYKEVYMNWPECTSANENDQNLCLAKNRCLILKYAELKALMGGTTSIQGSSSFDESSSDITFKGLTGYTIGSGNKISKSKARIVEDLLNQCSNDFARNIERETWRGKDVIRTTAQSISSDAFARKNINNAEKFKTTPSFKLLEEFKNKVSDKFFIHLSEGTDQSSREEWDELTYLKLNVPQVTVIHGTALDSDQLKKMGDIGESLLWSPTSNLLLYKKTTNVVEALKNKVNVALGSDWSLSGTKSLLYELKVADHANKKYFNNAISKVDLLKMVTINGAIASGLSDLIGSIEKNKFADFFLVSKKFQKDNPLDTLLNLKEEQIESVVVNGIPLVGNAAFLSKIADIHFTEPNDTSCYKDKVINIEKSFYDQMMNTLKSKTELGFKNLSLKFQTSLGNEFSKIDPLCSDNDLRHLSLINSL
jgi:cytosine/adenosine deaminase-related metal-dependent hydrolase